MQSYGNKKRSGGKRFLLVLLVAVALVALFLISFWVTSTVLKSNQEPNLSENSGIYASATPKPSYEELEDMVERKDKRIEELESELEKLKKAAPTKTPASTKAPVATQAPTKAPVVTKAPTKAPVATKTPTENPAAPAAAQPIPTPQSSDAE